MPGPPAPRNIRGRGVLLSHGSRSVFLGLPCEQWWRHLGPLRFSRGGVFSLVLARLVGAALAMVRGRAASTAAAARSEIVHATPASSSTCGQVQTTLDGSVSRVASLFWWGWSMHLRPPPPPFLVMRRCLGDQPCGLVESLRGHANHISVRSDPLGFAAAPIRAIPPPPPGSHELKQAVVCAAD